MTSGPTRRERPLRPLPVPGREPPARTPQPPPLDPLLDPPRVEEATEPASVPDEAAAAAEEVEPAGAEAVAETDAVDAGRPTEAVEAIEKPSKRVPIEGGRERRLVRFAIAALVAVVIAGAFAAIASRDRDNSTATGKKGNAIGPLAGAGLFDYATRAKEALADADGTRAAVVSFDRYVTEDDVPRALRGTTVKALLVAPIGGEARVVVGSLSSWAQNERRAAEEERQGLRGMLDTDDPAFKKQFMEDIERLTKVIEALDPNGPVVFGAVVVADADNLRELGRIVGIRLVDVGPSETPPAADRVRGIRPEERRYSNDPALRPLPAE